MQICAEISNCIGHFVTNTPNVVLSPAGLDNCVGDIVLNTRNNMDSGENKEYRTTQTIRATNRVGAGASTIYNAQEGISLDPGLEIEFSAEFQAIVEGCNN